VQCHVYRFDRVGAVDNTCHVEICIEETNIPSNKILADIHNTFISDEFSKAKGNLFVFENRCIVLFDASNEKGFLHSHVIRKDDKKVLGLIAGTYKCDNCSIVLLASHLIVQFHLKTVLQLFK